MFMSTNVCIKYVQRDPGEIKKCDILDNICVN